MYRIYVLSWLSNVCLILRRWCILYIVYPSLLFLKFVVQKMVISHIHVHVYLFDTVQYISVYHFCLHHLDQIRYICSIHVGNNWCTVYMYSHGYLMYVWFWGDDVYCILYIHCQLISSLELKLAIILKYQADTGYNDSSKLPILYLFYHMYTTYITNIGRNRLTTQWVGEFNDIVRSHVCLSDTQQVPTSQSRFSRSELNSSAKSKHNKTAICLCTKRGLWTQILHVHVYEKLPFFGQQISETITALYCILWSVFRYQCLRDLSS
jgi:hypothetical protein